MAIAHVQTVQVNQATTSSPAVTPTAPTTGNVQVLQIAVASGTSDRVSSISQTNCTWSRAVQSYNSTGGRGVEIWTAVVGSSPGGTITVTLVSSLGVSMCYHEFSGVDTTSPVEATGTSIDSASGFEG